MTTQPVPETAERPFLVLTKRRTGGTSLMVLMTQVSSFPMVQHEPFNKNRVWGAINERFKATQDSAAMRAELAAALGPRPNIKHCYEIIPKPITEALVELCVERGYEVFHLTREDEISRIRSLFVAQLSGAWGDVAARKVIQALEAGEKVLEPADLAVVRRRVAIDREHDAWLRQLLQAKAVRFTDLVFEEIYQRDGHTAERARQIVGQMGVTVAPDDPRLAAFSKRQGQKSADILTHVPNREAFERLLAELAAYRPA